MADEVVMISHYPFSGQDRLLIDTNIWSNDSKQIFILKPLKA